ncbi:AEC family transporter [Pseudomonadota bacterium]
MINNILAVILPVFICIGIGYLLARMEATFSTETVHDLVVNFGTPCLIFSVLTSMDLDLDFVGRMALAAGSVVGICALIGAVILKISGLSFSSFLPSLMFPNAGNMGLPLALFAFGETGLALAIAFYFVVAVAQVTLGMAIAAGEFSLRPIFQNPLIYAVLAALLFIYLGVTPPRWLANTTKLLGGLMIPLLLLTLGFSLAGLKIGGLWRSACLALLRLTLGFAVGVFVAELFGFEGATRGVVIMQSAMPVAVMTYLFALQFGNEHHDVAGAVVISSVMTLVTLPFLLWYVLPTG